MLKKHWLKISGLLVFGSLLAIAQEVAQEGNYPRLGEFGQGSVKAQITDITDRQGYDLKGKDDKNNSYIVPPPQVAQDAEEKVGINQKCNNANVTKPETDSHIPVTTPPVTSISPTTATTHNEQNNPPPSTNQETQAAPGGNHPPPAMQTNTGSTNAASEVDPARSFNGVFPSGGLPLGTNRVPAVNLQKISESAGTNARGVELEEAAERARQHVINAALHDQSELSEHYRRQSLDELSQSLTRSRDQSQQEADLIESSVSGIPLPEQGRFRNLFLNARDKADSGVAMIGDQKARESLSAVSPFADFLSDRTKNPLARNQDMADLFGANLPTKENVTTNDALENRMVLFNGLTPKEQKEVASKMNLVEPLKLTLKSGKQENLALLHNGYLFGGGSTSMDCSSFVSSLLQTDARKTRYTTLDLRSMWYYIKSGVLPLPPVYDTPRAITLKEAAQSFLAINLYEGEKLAPGDLLVYRTPWERDGHVFIVKSYDKARLRAEVIEASQTAGTLREREFSLTLDPPEAKRRLIQGGLYGLRLKPIKTTVCSYKDHAGNGRLPGSAGSTPSHGGAQ